MKHEFNRPQDRLILAVDVRSLAEASKIIRATKDYVGGFKFASIALTSGDEETLIAMAEDVCCWVMYDRKYHDIPMQNAGAARIIAERHANVRMITMHASAGCKAMQVMVKAMTAARPADPIMTVAITVLTSVSLEECIEMYGIPPEEVVPRFAEMAYSAGVQGIVCSGQEVGVVKMHCPQLTTIVPGTRSLEAANQDQARVVTPGQAIENGADYLVIGRQVTDLPTMIDMRNEIENIIYEVERALG